MAQQPTSALGPLSTWSAVVPALAGAATTALAAHGWVTSRRALARTTRALDAERRDEITGLSTRRTWTALARARVAAPGNELWLALVDLDELKPINDRLGHEAGDAVLAATAHRLTTTLPSPVHAGRLGGDEFALLVEHPPAGWQHQLDAQLATPLHLGETQVPVRASLGAVRVPSAGGDLTRLLGEADAAMYAIKTSRRTDGGTAGTSDVRDVPSPRPRVAAGRAPARRHPTVST